MNQTALGLADRLRSDRGLVALPRLPVPPELELVLGYTHDAAFVAFYWASEEGVLCFTDGTHAVCGSGVTNACGWHLYVTHPNVCTSLTGLDVYGATAIHALVLDRTERCMYSATVQVARDLLATHRVQPAVSEQQLAEFFSTLITMADQSPFALAESDEAEVMHGRAEQRRKREQALVDWLSRH